MVRGMIIGLLVLDVAACVAVGIAVARRYGLAEGIAATLGVFFIVTGIVGGWLQVLVALVSAVRGWF